MEGNDLYYLWNSIQEFIPNKDKEEACYTFLERIIEFDEEVIQDFYDIANDENDELTIKVVLDIKRQYNLEEEDY